jgi:glutathione S-transferase
MEGQVTITLWGRLSSANVQKVVWTLEELGLPYEHVPVGGRFGGNDTPDYLAMNPNGLVPTLRDGDLVVWESHAIVRYLAASYGAGTLWPADPKERASVDQWTDWTATTFQPAWIAVFWQLVRTPEPQRDRAAIDKSVAATNRCFSIMEQALSKSPYLAGSQLTYADIVAGTAMYRWTTMEVERPPMPAVEAWHGRLSERPAFRKAVSVDYEELRARLAF